MRVALLTHFSLTLGNVRRPTAPALPLELRGFGMPGLGSSNVRLHYEHAFSEEAMPMS